MTSDIRPHASLRHAAQRRYHTLASWLPYTVAMMFAGAHGALAQTPPNAGIPAQTVAAFDTLFSGPHEAARAVHANGIVVQGTFTPTVGAAQLTRAIHVNGSTIPVLARFSNFAPGADGAAGASPRGMAIRFQLPDGGSTDIVAHSYNGFPAATPDEFLAFLRALSSLETTAAFAATHPAARTFLNAPKPVPASYGTETYFGVSAFRFTNAAGEARFGRYRPQPVAGEAHLAASEAESRDPNFLSREIASRLGNGPVRFTLLVQIASNEDAVDNGAVAWPADRPVVELGTLSLTALEPNNDAAQRELRFVPTNLVGGIAPSSDPMLTARTQSYRISADRRGADR